MECIEESTPYTCALTVKVIGKNKKELPTKLDNWNLFVSNKGNILLRLKNKNTFLKSYLVCCSAYPFESLEYIA